jgi:hypothetical protein
MNLAGMINCIGLAALIVLAVLNAVRASIPRLMEPETAKQEVTPTNGPMGAKRRPSVDH